MPYRARQEFTQKTGYEFSDNSIIDRISNIGKTENTLEKIEQRTIQSMKTLIAGDAPKHERRRQEAWMRYNAKPSVRTLRAAKKLADQTTFVREYVGLCEKIIKATKLSQKKTVDDLLPNFGMTGEELVGLMRDQLNSYSYREGRRFELFRAVGIKNPRFLHDLNAVGLDLVDKRKVQYEKAQESDKAKIHEIYVTKDLVETRLNEKSGWWKFWHPGQTKAMEAYKREAEKLLNDVGFPNTVPTAAKIFADQGYAFADPNRKAELEKQFSQVIEEVNAKLSEAQKTVDAKNAEKLAEQRKQETERQAKLDAEAQAKALQEEEARKQKESAQKQIDEKLAASKDEAALVRNMELKDQFFQIRFRPSLDDTMAFEKQNNALKELLNRELIQGKHLPKDVKQVLTMNYQKIQKAKELLRDKIPHMTNDAIEKAKNNLLSTFVDAEESLQQKLSDYKPKTLEELESNWKLQQQLQADTGSKENAPQEVSPKHNDPVVQKETSRKEIN